MINNFLSYLVFLLLLGSSAGAQGISSIAYRGKVIIPHDDKANGLSIGGLSAITFNVNDSSYYLVADKPPARIFKVNISPKALPEITFERTLKLSPVLLSKAELEGIAYNPETNHFYVADEQKDGTRIIELNSEAKFLRIIEPVNQPFIPLSGHNSGIEGLTITHDLKYLYYSFERPAAECLDESLVKVVKMALTKPGNYQTYFYKLHHVADDQLNTNGISDIIFLSDFKLLVMERAYIYGKGNVVRLYEAYLEGRGNPDREISCTDDSIALIKSRLLFDFADVPEIEIDNAEGMTFNAGKSVLYIITDNNFSKKQETQIIALDVIWK